MLHAIIMAGGAGTRFWPASRNTRPKQLLRLVSERTMIQATVDRLQGLVSDDCILVVTNRALVAPIREQVPQLPGEALIGEPCKRDTAPCIGLAALLVSRRDEQATMLVLPADQLIQPREAFQATVEQARRIVEQHPQRMVTFGIRPTYPAESFGYIERGAPLPPGQAGGSLPAYRVHLFREKPKAKVAEEYLASGRFYWNSGIFVWKARTILQALRHCEPAMYQHLETIAATLGSDAFEATLEREFAAIRGKSIDYAVMEKYHDVAVIEAPFQWDDAGSWRSLARTRGTDADGNTVDGRHLGLGTRGCIIRGEGNHLIVTIGLEDCIVVHTPDATLVARKQDEESVRQAVAMIQQQGWEEYL